MQDEKHLKYTPGAHRVAGHVQARRAVALAQAVYGERMKRAITQEGLAERMGADVDFVKALEEAVAEPSFELLEWLAGALGAADWSVREGEGTEFTFHGHAA